MALAAQQSATRGTDLISTRPDCRDDFYLPTAFGIPYLQKPDEDKNGKNSNREIAHDSKVRTHVVRMNEYITEKLSPESENLQIF